MNAFTQITRTTVAAFVIALAAGPLAAETDIKTSEPGTNKQDAAIGAGAVVGGIVGGPIGFAIGTAAGALIGNNLKKRDQLNYAEQEMNAATQQIAALENEITLLDTDLDELQQEANQLERDLLTRLEFQVLFRTGEDELSQADHERVAMLVKYLNQRPDLDIRLDGHADNRGTDEYNQVLATFRAKSVADALVAGGIDPERIETRSFGDSKSFTKTGDVEGYALDRRVHIQVYSPALEAEQIAQVDSL